MIQNANLTEGGLKKPTFLESLGENVIDSTHVYPKPNYLLYQDGTGFAASGNIMAIKGKAKAGKNQTEAIIIASLLGCEDFDLTSGLRSANRKIIVEDTDQHSFHTSLTKQRVQRLLGWETTENQSELTFINARRMRADERMTCLRKAITEVHPDVMVVDNVLHIESNFNDPSASRTFVDELIRLADENDCLLIVVLHENKSSADSNMKGHIGTMLGESATDVLEILKDGSQHHIKHVVSRDKPIEPITFIINDNGLPQLAKAAAQEKKEQKELERQIQRNKAFTEILDGGVLLSYTELVSAYRDKVFCGNTKAEDDLKLAVNDGVILKNADRKYYLNNMPY